MEEEDEFEVVEFEETLQWEALDRMSNRTSLEAQLDFHSLDKKA